MFDCRGVKTTEEIYLSPGSPPKSDLVPARKHVFPHNNGPCPKKTLMFPWTAWVVTRANLSLGQTMCFQTKTHVISSWLYGSVYPLLYIPTKIATRGSYLSVISTTSIKNHPSIPWSPWFSYDSQPPFLVVPSCIPMYPHVSWNYPEKMVVIPSNQKKKSTSQKH